MLTSIILTFSLATPVSAATTIKVTNSAPVRNITGTRNNLTEQDNLKYNIKATNLKVNVGHIKSASIDDLFWARFLDKLIYVNDWDISPNNVYVGRAYLTIDHLNKNKWYTFVGPTWNLDSPLLQKITAKPNKKGEIKYLTSDYYYNYDSPYKNKKDISLIIGQQYAPALTRINKKYQIKKGKKVRLISDNGSLTSKYLKGGHYYSFVAKMKINHYGLCYQLRDHTGDQYWLAKKYLKIK